MSNAADTIVKDAAKAAQLIKTTAEQTATTLNIQYIQQDISEIKQSIKEMTGIFVTQTEFKPIRNIVSGMVSIAMISIVGAIISLVIIK